MSIRRNIFKASSACYQQPSSAARFAMFFRFRFIGHRLSLGATLHCWGRTTETANYTNWPLAGVMLAGDN